MNTKLVDFNKRQLQIMLNALEQYRSDIGSGHYPKKSLGDQNLVDDLNLLRTQLLTAIGIVGFNEKVNSN